ncbi:hypothetical protein QBC46DRAFT_372226 [Diplogelasinospora grovesii]|uniref:Ubiquitin-protein ligase sel1 n=1 Tax=Diplogelasinospora grovesii TaxID=303347 RepID=A0AAN6NHW4_9PEZI|nr:hypothetical protein QBC46DRAFT_372226 [Diplogelasinospora grovesii]
MDTKHLAHTVLATLVSRQIQDGRNCTRDEDGFIVESDTCFVGFWYTRTGVIVKWSIFLGLSAILGLYLLLGYMHARRRLRKGLAPLAYHRWLVSRSELARVDPRYRPPNASAMPYNPNSNSGGYQYYGDGIYGMSNMPPPPVYDPNAPRPPMYDGLATTAPPGATKVDPQQTSGITTAAPTRQATVVEDDFEAPAGPPPNAMRPENTGSSNPFLR